MTASTTETYEFRIAGSRRALVAAWSEGMAIVRHEDGTSALTGSVTDQRALHGFLIKLRVLGATLLALYWLDRAGAPPRRDGR